MGRDEAQGFQSLLRHLADLQRRPIEQIADPRHEPPRQGVVWSFH